MEGKSTKELLKIIRDNQTRLASDILGYLNNDMIDKYYNEIHEAESIIISRTKE